MFGRSSRDPRAVSTRGIALLVGVLLAAVGPSSTSPSAAAVATRAGSPIPAWGVLQALPRDVSSPVITADAQGSVWGVGRLGAWAGAPMAVLHRPPGGAWTARALPVVGSPMAVADDGRTTFLLYATTTGCGIPCQIRILRIPHGGTPSPPRLLDRTDGDFGGATLIARDGQWWAAWAGAVKRVPRPRTEGDYRYYVHEARTLGTSYATRNLVSGGPEVRAAHPQLAFRGRYQVLLKLDRPQHIEFWVAGLPTGTLQRTPSRIASNGHYAGVPSAVTTSGTRTLVAFSRWSDKRLTVAQDDADLVFRYRTTATRGSAPYPRIAASSGRVFVAYGDCASLMDCRGYVATGRLSGGFSITEVTAPLVAPGQTDRRHGITALTAARGRATVLFGGGPPNVYARSQQ